MATGFPVKANYATGDVLTAANMNDLSGTVNYLQYMPPRNSVLNSAFNVWQRGTSFTGGTSATYSADRWVAFRNGVTGSTFSRQVTNDATNLPNIQYCMRVSRDSGNTSTQNIQLIQSMETVNSIPFAGKTVTLSFYARSGANFSAASSALNVLLQVGTGTDQSTAVGYTGGTNQISSTATLTTTWTRFTYTASIPSTTTEMGFQFYYTPVGTAGAADYFEITGVQLELGSVANTYMPNQPTYQGELAACQRYYFRTSGTAAYQTLGISWSTGTTTANAIIQTPVTMRVPPTSVDFSTLCVEEYSGGLATLSGVTLANLSNTVATLSITGLTGFTAGRIGRLLTYNSSSGYVGLSAEL